MLAWFWYVNLVTEQLWLKYNSFEDIIQTQCNGFKLDLKPIYKTKSKESSNMLQLDISLKFMFIKLIRFIMTTFPPVDSWKPHT